MSFELSHPAARRLRLARRRLGLVVALATVGARVLHRSGWLHH